MSKSIAVLGLGKFGRSLAENLYSLGMDLMVVDRDPEVVREFASKSTIAVCANLENEDEIHALDLKHMDIVVVSMGTSLAPSVMSVVEANNEIRILRSKEQEEIERLLAEFSAELGAFADQISNSYRILTELILIFVKAHLAY